MSKAERFAKIVPDPYILITIIIALSTAATYIIPAGEYNRQTVEGTKTVVPGSFHYISQQPASIAEFFLSIQLGLIDAASIVFFIMLVGGALGILNYTGALEAGIAKISVRAQKSGNRNIPLIVIPLVVGFMGGVIGSFEELIPFIPLMVLLSRSLDYDAIVGCSLILLGSTAGFASAPLNPFTVGVAQGIADLPLFSGMWYRWIFWGVSMTVTIAYIYRYASKVRKDPSKSYVSDIDYSEFSTDTEISDIEFEKDHYVILSIFSLAIVVLIIGVIQFGWFINEIGTLFLVTGVVSGIVYGLDGETIVEQFIEGVSTVTYAALIVGVARGIIVILESGSILDTIIFSLIQPLQQLPGPIAGALIVPVMTIINFFIPSGSGQAAVVIPILAPVADVINIPRQAIILAFQYGDGFSNMFIPTSGATMAMISLADIPYGRWIFYTAKLLALQLIIGMIAVIIAVMINLGPT